MNTPWPLSVVVRQYRCELRGVVPGVVVPGGGVPGTGCTGYMGTGAEGGPSMAQ